MVWYGVVWYVVGRCSVVQLGVVLRSMVPHSIEHSKYPTPPARVHACMHLRKISFCTLGPNVARLLMLLNVRQTRMGPKKSTLFLDTSPYRQHTASLKVSGDVLHSFEAYCRVLCTGSYWLYAGSISARYGPSPTACPLHGDRRGGTQKQPPR